MIGATLVLHIEHAVRVGDRVQLLIRTPLAGLAGLATLLIVLYLLAGGEIRNWRSMLRRRRPPTGGGDESTPAIEIEEIGPGTSGDADNQVPPGADPGIDALTPLENTPIAANLP